MSLPTSPVPQPLLEVGATTVDSFRSSLPRRLTLKSSASTLADGNHSPYNGELLTPPLRNPSLDEPPFRPVESDRTSLNMKRRHGFSHQRRRRHNRACVSSGDVDQTALPSESPKHILSLSRSKSAPSLANLLLDARGRNEISTKGTLRNNINPTQETELASHRNTLAAHPRRWTIPGKAAPTRVLTSMSPSAVLPKQHESTLEEEQSNDRVKSIETPAMITLQRAASGSKSRRTSLRPEAYTSFPTPTFSKTKTGFVNTFWGDGWQRLDNTTTCASIKSASIAVHNDRHPSSSGRASIDHDNVRPSQSTTVSPVCTDVVLAPFIQEQATETQLAFRARRCSTKYVSGSSTYEIIWDENVSTSSSGSRRTSTEQGRRISMRDNDNEPNRRLSVAIGKLEMQLSRGFEQSIKKSSASRGFSAIKSTSATCPSTNRMSFHNILSLQQAESDAEEESRGLPRSRSSTTSKPKLTGRDMEVDLTTVTDDETSTRHMGYFPPLSSNHNDFRVPEDPLLANPWRTSWETRNDTAPVLPNPANTHRGGSMIGQSTGVRKKSVYMQTPRLARKTGSTRRRHKSRDEEDRKPLLGQFNNWSNEAFS